MEPSEQSIKQKKIAFAQSEHIEAVITILREISRHEALVADTEFKTIVNAVTMDAQGEMIIKFINTIDFIKQGGLNQTP